MKIILINGPPRAGKSTLAKMLHKLEPHSQVLGFSYHLKRMVHGIYFGRAGWDMDPDCFDDVKTIPQDMLDGKTWREMYIFYSEKVIKPLHGKEWFGTKFVEACKMPFVFVPDSGFVEEAERVMRYFGPDNLTLVRLYREGATFAGDSRSYIELPGVFTTECMNVSGRVDHLEGFAKELLQC
jgi:energy-coupling factor transporter ATP-binding protein EcfA2